MKLDLLPDTLLVARLPADAAPADAAAFAAILAAEYVLRLVPPRTHEWQKFVTPAEAAAALRAGGLAPEPPVGLAYDPLSGEWSRSVFTGVNFAITARRI
jgi:2-polyprenyl-6-hydroxyphenyl methylase/3-demethylubiquinone-9 3-methyltransferase